MGREFGRQATDQRAAAQCNTAAAKQEQQGTHAARAAISFAAQQQPLSLRHSAAPVTLTTTVERSGSSRKSRHRASSCLPAARFRTANIPVLKARPQVLPATCPHRGWLCRGAQSTSTCAAAGTGTHASVSEGPSTCRRRIPQARRTQQGKWAQQGQQAGTPTWCDRQSVDINQSATGCCARYSEGSPSQAVSAQGGTVHPAPGQPASKHVNTCRARQGHDRPGGGVCALQPPPASKAAPTSRAPRVTGWGTPAAHLSH